MNDWSSSDMIKMQDEAKKRVMEMKDRSRFAAEDMNRSIAGQTDEGLYDKVKAIKMPVELPEKKRKEKAGITKPEQLPEKINADKKQMIKNVFGDLSEDELEKMFILSLCLLLSYEQCDEEIMLALMYILT